MIPDWLEKTRKTTEDEKVQRKLATVNLDKANNAQRRAYDVVMEHARRGEQCLMHLLGTAGTGK